MSGPLVSEMWHVCKIWRWQTPPPCHVVFIVCLLYGTSGVITYLLLSGYSPFGGRGGPDSLIEMRDNIINCHYKFEPEDIWENVSDNAKLFIRRILVTDVSMRPTAREAQKDAWLTKMNCSKELHDRALNPEIIGALVNFKEYSHMRKFLCEVLSFALVPDQTQELRREFEKIDADGSGEISLSSLKTILLGNTAQGSLGALSEGEVEDIFNAMSVGSAETTIHWHKFIAAGLIHCQVDERNLKLAFDRLDADHTGFITFDNVMDLIGDCAEHSEEILYQMWREASASSSDAQLAYEDFLFLMKSQTKQNSRRAAVEAGTNEGTAVKRVSIERGFMFPTLFEAEAPICIDDDGDNEALNQGFPRTMVNRELYRAHRPMRLAASCLGGAAKRACQVKQRRRSHNASVDAFKQFVVQQQKEEQKMIREAKNHAGRRHSRKKSSSDIRGMFGDSGPDVVNPSSFQRCTARSGRISSGTFSPMTENTVHNEIHNSCSPPLEQHQLQPATPQEAPTTSDLANVPINRKATTPGLFRKTSYDPFRSVLAKATETGRSLADSSFCGHLDLSIRYKRVLAKAHESEGSLADSSFRSHLYLSLRYKGYSANRRRVDCLG